MNRLEKYIRDNKSQFDEEPAEGHFERLQKKIDRKSGKTNILQWCISVAASIAILLTASAMWQNNKSSKEDSTASCEDAIDMKLCYLEKMNVVAIQIEELIKDFDRWDKQQVMDDVQDIVYFVNSDFESELPEELPDNEIKLILLDYYNRNLESLEMIVEELKIINYEL